jgi:hypothetical protein
LLSRYQKYSKQFKDADLAKIGDETAFTAIEDSIYADAMHEARHPTTSLRPGELRPVIIKDGAGREMRGYAGHDGACWDRFNPPIRHVRRILTPGTPLAS